ncbi:MAG: PD-(D/E)XK nuclease family protein, partial [Kiritimatiellae bacterium]|nr:PD-(D/E)XK nuclease family protein [Kiritimatiellia bacterium]
EAQCQAPQAVKKPIDEVVDKLADEVRSDPSGAKSLAHLLVVVPTAQSGRRLRLKLAERLGALIPPTVKLSQQLLVDEDAEIAGRTDELLAFQEALGEKGSLDIAAQFSDIRGILGGNALTFADVADRIGEILTDETADFEIERWKGFAELEESYFAALAKRGKTDRIVAMKKVIADPPRLEGIEKVIVAYVLDPIPAVKQVLANLQAKSKLEVEELECSTFQTSQTPQTFQTFQTSQIFPCATAASEAEKVAEIFAAVKEDEMLPSLCVADAEEFPEIQGALQAKGLKVHDPSRTLLVTSSLGHLVEQVAALVWTRSYNVFSAFIRGGDVRRWLCAELKISSAEYVDALNKLDNAQAKLLPEKIDDIGPKTSGKLRAIFEHIDVTIRKKGIRAILQSVFAAHILDERDPDAREFAAAAETVNGLIDECGDNRELFSFRLREATYSLEPDEGDAILTDGWLELPFLDADELIVTGFNEGRVPESVVGHAFLPDRLRRGLGLADNESRTNRDREILRLAVGCREEGAVRVFFRAVDAKGDVLKPSRLLFDCADEADFIGRVKAFYGMRAGTEEMKAADLPDAWRLKLEIPSPRKPLEFTSPSSLDLYLRCPFTYCLKKTFGEKEDDRAEELDPSEFGNLAHDALELWGAGALKDSEDADAIAAELAAHVDGILGKRFGTSIPAIVALQGESMKRRLAAFAKIQAVRHAEGWRTVAAERKLQVKYGHTTVKGRCDRIDFNGRTGEWCVVDYKTFDNPDRAVWRDGKTGEWKSLQLPLYCAMLDADPEFPDAKLEKISSAYCVLGKTSDTTLFTGPMNGAFVAEAEAKVRALIDRIERGIFWPPSPKDAWRWDFADWIFNTPDASVDPAWLADQMKRMEDPGE